MRQGVPLINPVADRRLEAGDLVAVLGSREGRRQFIAWAMPAAARPPEMSETPSR